MKFLHFTKRKHLVPQECQQNKQIQLILDGIIHFTWICHTLQQNAKSTNINKF